MLEEEPDNYDGERADDDQPAKPGVQRLFPVAPQLESILSEKGREDIFDVFAKIDEDRGKSPQLNDRDKRGPPLRGGNSEINPILAGQREVARAAYRKKLRDALDDTEDDGLTYSRDLPYIDTAPGFMPAERGMYLRRVGV